MRLFEVVTPDGRRVRQLAESSPALQAGYTLAGEVFGADASRSGGVVISISPGHNAGRSMADLVLEIVKGIPSTDSKEP